MAEEQKLYTTQEVASILGITDRRVRQLVEQGKAQPVQQIGGTWVFNAEEIERLKSRPTKPGRRS
jgi:excisionase family DNA binding protein